MHNDQLVKELEALLQAVVNDFDSGWRDQHSHYARGYYYAMTLLSDLPGVRASLNPELLRSLDQIREEVEPVAASPSQVDEIAALVETGRGPNNITPFRSDPRRS